MTHEERTRRFVLHAYRRAAARHEIRQLGHPLPDPVDPDDLWRTRFEDLIFRNVTGVDPRPVRHLRVLDGGSEGSVVGRRPGPEDAASAVVGGKPSRVASAQPEAHPTNLTGRGSRGAGPRLGSLPDLTHHQPPTSTEED